MNKYGMGYSLTCFLSGLALWYASPHYFYESKPHKVFTLAIKEKSLDVLVDDAYSHAFPSGIFTRPMTYVGFAGIVLSAFAKKRENS